MGLKYVLSNYRKCVLHKVGHCKAGDRLCNTSCKQIADIIGYTNASKNFASLLCRAGLSWRTQDWKLFEPKTRIWVEIQMHSVLIHIIYLYVISYMGLKYARLDTSCLIMDFIWITHLCLEYVLYKHYVRLWNIYNLILCFVWITHPSGIHRIDSII